MDKKTNSLVKKTIYSYEVNTSKIEKESFVQTKCGQQLLNVRFFYVRDFFANLYISIVKNALKTMLLLFQKAICSNQLLTTNF